MGMIRFLILLLIAFVCGSIGASLAGSSKKGCFTSIILGFVGAIIGSWLSDKLDTGDLLYIRGIPVVWSIIGSALFVAVLNLISGGGNSGKK
ncbi:MAG: GlsB/YeaQ/YmgE family stress response membrane protein [bacterium]|nr:GlsB/YeaQ/YmgE family stress response membrane protein [bacterium]